MFVPQKPKKTKPKVRAAQADVVGTRTTFQSLATHEQISHRAYEIYERGGSINGRDQQDWFAAEREMLLPITFRKENA